VHAAWPVQAVQARSALAHGRDIDVIITHRAIGHVHDAFAAFREFEFLLALPERKIQQLKYCRPTVFRYGYAAVS
jgi:hypothetical protein